MFPRQSILVFQVKSNPEKQTVSLVTNIPVLLAAEDAPENPYSHV